MKNNQKFITYVFLFGILTILPISENVWSSEPAGPIQNDTILKTVTEYETPEYFVPPPPFSEGIFPCSDCHADMEVNPVRRKLEDEHVEISERFNHASAQRWCLDCHNPDDRDQLRLANGDLVSFEKSYDLCGQCHGTIFRDWKAGIHGKRTGEWNGKKQYRLCVHCHNPHNPRFKPIRPLPPPDNPLEIKYRKLSEEEIPRNPLGNIQ